MDHPSVQRVFLRDIRAPPELPTYTISIIGQGFCLRPMRELRMAVTRGLRLCRTWHETRIHGGVERNGALLSKPSRSIATTPASLDAPKEMDASIAREPEALPCRTELQCRISPCWFLFARTR